MPFFVSLDATIVLERVNVSFYANWTRLTSLFFLFLFLFISLDRHGGFFPFPMFGGYGSESDRQDTGGQDVPPGAPMPPMDTPAPSPGTFGGAAAPPPPPPPAPSHDYDDGWLSDDEAGVFSPDDDDTDWGEAIGSTLRGFFEDR